MDDLGGRKPPAGVPEWDIDPYDVEILKHPTEFFTELRRKGPFVWFSRYGVLGCGRYAEVREVFSDWRRFVSGRGVGMSDFKHEKPWRTPSLVLETDPPEHTRARNVIGLALAPRAVAALKDRFQQEADLLVDRLLEKGTFECVTELAEPYPLKVFPDAVGITADNRKNLITYGAMVFNGVGPDNAIRRETLAHAAEVVPWIMAKCARDAITKDGFAAAIYEGVDRGEVSEEEAGLLVRSLLSAGIDTTVTAIGNAMWCFINNPDQFEVLKNDPSMARNAFEEVLRYTSPIQSFYRTADLDTQVSGIDIPEGTKIYCALGSANLDEEQWPEAARFDISRKTGGHVAFGVGIHGCVGQHVARQEGEAVLNAIARKVAKIEAAGEAEWRPGNSIRALDRFDISFLR